MSADINADVNNSVVNYLQGRIEKYEQKRELLLANIKSSIEMIKDIIDYLNQGLTIEDSINSCVDDTLQNIFEIENKIKKTTEKGDILLYQEELYLENSAYTELLIIRKKFNVN